MQITLEGINGSGELWVDIMKIICGDTAKQSMVDLGCHLAPYTPLLGFRERTYVDVQDRPLDHADEKKWLVQSDVVDFLKSTNNFYDTAIASDLIEHLSKERGKEMLTLMEYRSHKQIIFTPLGAWMISEDKHPDSHLSGWIPEMLPDYVSIVLPDFHPTLTVGAFFSFNCSGIEKERIINEIKIKYAFYDKD